MSQAKNAAQGFTTMASAIWILTCAWVPTDINVWFGLGLFLLLAVPFTLRGIGFLKSLTREMQTQARVKQVKSILMSFQGVSLACWTFDVATTYLSVNIRGNVELNPLGWPLGIVGAAAYYIPAVVGVYILLYKTKSKGSFYAAAVLTALTLFMGYMNLNAGITNFRNLRAFSYSSPNWELVATWIATGTILSALNTAVIIQKRVDARTEKQKVQASQVV